MLFCFLSPPLSLQCSRRSFNCQRHQLKLRNQFFHDFAPSVVTFIQNVLRFLSLKRGPHMSQSGDIFVSTFRIPTSAFRRELCRSPRRTAASPLNGKASSTCCVWQYGNSDHPYFEANSLRLKIGFDSNETLSSRLRFNSDVFRLGIARTDYSTMRREEMF